MTLRIERYRQRSAKNGLPGTTFERTSWPRSSAKTWATADEAAE
jgi:hypothetical protein